MNDEPRETSHRTNPPLPTFALSEIGIEDRDLRIEMFVICEGAAEQNGRLSLIGTYDVVHASHLPCVVPQITAALRVRFWPEECRVHTFRLALTRPDGETASEPVEVTATLQPSSEERSAAYNLIAQLQNLLIEEAGEYTLDFYLDGKIEGRLPICICQAAAS
jgi:hypothetical protein